MPTVKKGVSETDTNNNTAASEPAVNNVGAEAAETTPTEKARYEGVTTFAYVGPSLPGGRLKSNAVLNGTYAEITEYYKEAFALYPSAAKLIVPVTRLAETREKIQSGGNVMYNYYTEVAAAIKPKGEE